MSVLTIEMARVEPPVALPVEYLSWSSLRTFMSCPIKWKRRYLDKEPEPPSGKMLLGSAAGAALAQHYGRQIETGEGIPTEELLDEFSAEWEDRCSREEVDYERETPGELKDSGARALSMYHRVIAPTVTPTSVEREFRLSWPGVEWTLTGFLDLEDDEGQVRDYKLTGRKITQPVADADLQATIYLAARRAERNPAPRLCFDAMVRTKQPSISSVRTERTDAELDALTDRIFALAREIHWRTEYDVWSGAPVGTWFCSYCRYTDCPLRLGRI
jgi:hypothetical protein